MDRLMILHIVSVMWRTILATALLLLVLIVGAGFVRITSMNHDLLVQQDKTNKRFDTQYSELQEKYDTLVERQAQTYTQQQAVIRQQHRLYDWLSDQNIDVPEELVFVPFTVSGGSSGGNPDLPGKSERRKGGKK